MPKDNPSPAQLWQGEVSFFSIDTDLIQGAGYNFDEGALNQLPKQLPRTMQLQLTEVVAREIIGHRMESVREAMQQFASSSDRLKRSASIDMAEIDLRFAALSVADTAPATFRKKVEDYAERCRGGILPVQGKHLVVALFEKYFSGMPPFANRKDKKSEFPDAASLVLLEQYAIDNDNDGHCCLWG